MTAGAHGLARHPGASPEARELLEPKSVPVRRLPVIDAHGERVEPPARGERLLRAGESLFSRLDAVVTRFVRPEYNPFNQTGAIANTSFIIACVTGVIVLIWYRTSVHHAYESVAAMRTFPAALVRSLHRYSSDAALAFALLHAVKLFFARRFGGARWLAWLTGGIVVFLLWLVGWLGYWLVWDDRGHKVALATAHLLDALPIFADPLSRSFLTDDRVGSLLFFVVFFLHMLIPLAMGIGLWLHITRLARPRFLTTTPMTLWVLASLSILSLVAPADLGAPAKMAVIPRQFAMDAWFLWPIELADRLSTGAAWALVLFVGAALISVPWTLSRGRARPAVVNQERCNACGKCYADCPYDAIRMAPRSDGSRYPTVALVDPDKCVGCGVCAGSCDSSGIGLPWFDAIQQRHRIDGLVADAAERAQRRTLVLACAGSAAADLVIDPETGSSSELPGHHVVRVPCAGWIHPLLVERALRRGAARVHVVACGPGSCAYREGGEHTLARMAGEREPKLRLDRVGDRVQVLELYRHQRQKLVSAARSLLGAGSGASGRARFLEITAGLVLAGSILGLTWGVTQTPYRAPGAREPELLISLKVPGRTEDTCRPLTPEEQRSRPIHMRRTEVCERRRADVRLRVFVDGREELRRSYPPRGLWGDGHSIALERVVVREGPRTIRVEIGDSADPAAYAYTSERRVNVEPGRRTVVLFDRGRSFTWR